MRPRAKTSLILALACGLAVGCGGDDEENGEPIPAGQAAALERQLESIENRFQFGGDACRDITGNADPNTTAVRSVLDSLPRDVNPEVRDALDQSFERLFELVQEQCDENSGQEEQQAPPVDTGPTVPPAEEEGDDEGDEEEETPTTPPEEGPTGTTPPTEVPPEGPTGTTGQGGAGGGNSGQGGSGTAGQGGGGGALVPGDTAP